MAKRLLMVSLLAAMVMPALARDVQDESFGDKVRALFQEGSDLYKRGKYQEASSKFEEAFQMQPSSDAVYAFMKRVGDDMIARMMNDPDRKIQDIGRRIYELAKPGEPGREGKEIILKYVKDLESASHEEWRLAFWHLKNIGPWAVRFVMPALGNQQNDQLRSRVILLFTEMGTDASLAVVEALNSKNPFLRQQAAIVLGNVKDERAIPALRRVTENPNEPAEVVKFANEALRKIIRSKDAAQWRKATDYYYQLAEKYYYSHSNVIHYWNRAYLIWKWDVEKDTLTERRVARMAYNEQLAEEALYDLLDLDENYVDPGTKFSPWSLLACVHFAQALEAIAALEAAIDALKVDEIDKKGLVKLLRDIEGMSDESVKEIGAKIEGAASPSDVQQVVLGYLRSDKLAKVIRANVLGELPGKKYIYEGLARCLADGNYLVGTACIDTIAEMGRPEDLPAPAAGPEGATTNGEKKPEQVAGTGNAAAAAHGTMGYPLVEALTNEDKRVRYAAARAMVAINPQRRKLGMELVIPNLVDAIGEQGVRVALLVYDVQDDNDRNFVNGFRKLLTGINVFPVVVHSGAEGIVKAKQFPTEDVIILQKKICGQVYFKESDTKKQIVETVFDTLRDDVRTRNIPRIVLGDTEGEVNDAKKEYQEKGTAQGVIGRDVHKLDLQKMLEDIFDLPEAKKDSKDRADLIARDAAETLSRIDPTNTLYPFRDAVEALIKTVSPEILREDFIRIPSARALGRYGDQRAIDVLAKVVSDRDEDAEKRKRQKGVRLATSKALSSIFQQTGVSPNKEVYDVLRKNTKDGDFDIEFNCGEALGNATLDNKQRRDVSNFRRIEREVYTAEDP